MVHGDGSRCHSYMHSMSYSGEIEDSGPGDQARAQYTIKLCDYLRASSPYVFTRTNRYTCRGSEDSQLYVQKPLWRPSLREGALADAPILCHSSDTHQWSND